MASSTDRSQSKTMAALPSPAASQPWNSKPAADASPLQITQPGRKSWFHQHMQAANQNLSACWVDLHRRASSFSPLGSFGSTSWPCTINTALTAKQWLVCISHAYSLQIHVLGTSNFQSNALVNLLKHPNTQHIELTPPCAS